MPSYVELQKQANFHINDTVVVMRIARHGEQEWENTWADVMNLSVGKILTITNILDASGIRLSDSYAYPYFVLKKVNEYKSPEHIKVGAIVKKGISYLVITEINGLECRCRLQDEDELNHKHYTFHDNQLEKP